MSSTGRRKHFDLWIEKCHVRQKIRKSGEAYFAHLKRVANIAEKYASLAYEVGIAHDLLEDTPIVPWQLFSKLIELGYPVDEANAIYGAVVELTDVFTKDAYPLVKKKERKKMEAARLEQTGSLAQTVKYADILDNIAWVLKYDAKHGKKYLNRKRNLVAGLQNGNAKLRNETLKHIDLHLATKKV